MTNTKGRARWRDLSFMSYILLITSLLKLECMVEEHLQDL